MIGILQGTLAGIALAFGGVPSALFWAVAMMFLSVVPGIGTALIWIPAVIYIGVNTGWLLALVVGAFCAVIVGSVDNILRPKLVGGDTQLHELLIFFSTLGGLLIFGFWGFVIGPIIAALFVTVWELYGEEFSHWLPTSAFMPSSSRDGLPGMDTQFANSVDAEHNETPHLVESETDLPESGSAVEQSSELYDQANEMSAADFTEPTDREEFDSGAQLVQSERVEETGRSDQDDDTDNADSTNQQSSYKVQQSNNSRKSRNKRKNKNTRRKKG